MLTREFSGGIREQKKTLQLRFITKRFISYIVSFHVFVIFQNVCLRLFESHLAQPNSRYRVLPMIAVIY
jgi:hypothetical protein